MYLKFIYFYFKCFSLNRNWRLWNWRLERLWVTLKMVGTKHHSSAKAFSELLWSNYCCGETPWPSWLIREIIKLGACLRFLMVCPTSSWMVVHGGTWAVTKNFTSCFLSRKNWTGPRMGFWNLKVLQSQDIQFRTSSNKVTPPNPYLDISILVNGNHSHSNHSKQWVIFTPELSSWHQRLRWIFVVIFLF